MSCCRSAVEPDAGGDRTVQRARATWRLCPSEPPFHTLPSLVEALSGSAVINYTTLHGVGYHKFSRDGLDARGM